uniref:NADH-ubiquinone oxidoreductase chain 1 n=1 Tax=Calophya schini TaxID=121824 RepID=A0A343LDR0_9HEMI|nr:NADH dehydrogenase subunit 1 [Calophya schini]
MLYMNFVSCLLMLIFSLIGVAFLTLLERKILGYVQFRKGPNSVGILGLFQPFSDAVKLYTKEFFFPSKSNYYIYWVTPFISIVISLVVWVCFPYNFIVLSWKLTILFMFMILSFSVYGVMICGWASNSNYALLGSMRVLAQSISYEVSFFMLILSMLFFVESLSFNFFILDSFYNYLIFLLLPIFFMLFVSFLAELNRTPFDFSEGESELVSGFNVEYGGSGFAFIFLAEYLSILFASFILTLTFLGGVTYSLIFYFKLSFLSFMIILIRGSLPRYRYDKLMSMCWKVYLTSSLLLFFFYTSISV